VAVLIHRLEEQDELDARYGFVPLEGAAEGGPQRMFLDIRTIRGAVKSQR
jgi:hypothetical protein